MKRTTKTRDDLIQRRRELVARLRVRQLSVREIARELAKITEDGKHPFAAEDGTPIAHVQIVRDLKHIRAEWRTAMLDEITDHKARQVAELSEVKREAMKAGDLRAWLGAIKQEAQILGTDAPVKVQVKSWQDEIIDLIRTGRASVDDVKAELGADLAAQLFREAGVPVESA